MYGHSPGPLKQITTVKVLSLATNGVLGVARTLLGMVLTFGLQISLHSDLRMKFAGLNEVDERGE